MGQVGEAGLRAGLVPLAEAGLRVDVDGRDRLAHLGERHRQMCHQRRFAGAAFLLGHGQDKSGHDMLLAFATIVAAGTHVAQALDAAMQRIRRPSLERLPRRVIAAL